MADITFFDALSQDTEPIRTVLVFARYILMVASVLLWTAAAVGIWYLCGAPHLQASGARHGRGHVR